MFASLLDVTDNFESLNRYLVIGDTEVQAFLEKFVGFLGGFILLAWGLVKWFPSIQRLSGEVAESRQAENALRAAHETLNGRLGRILDNSFNEIYVFDATTYHFTQVSKGAQSNLGYTWQELSHLTPWDLKPAFDEKRFHAAIEPLRSGEKEKLVFETEHRRKDGSVYPVEVRLQLSMTETPPAFFAIIADITERKRIDGDLRYAKEQAEDADRAKSEFLASMSHELRTPLNAIIGFSEIIKKETFGSVGNPKYQEYSVDIHDAGQHLLGLINDILDLSKIEAGTEELQEYDVDLLDIAQSSLMLVEQRAEDRDIRLELDVPDDVPALHADERKVKQILVNMLSNAVKFTEPGGTVTLRAWCDFNNGHTIEIADTGIGIAPEDFSKALSRFGQVDGLLSRQYEGTGLGLPLSVALVELHGGTLDLQSEIGVGTTVTLRFPRGRVVAPRNLGSQAMSG